MPDVRATVRFFLSVAAGCCLTVSLCLAKEPTPPPGEAGRLVERFHMRLVPEEGVWFAMTYISADQILGDALPSRYGGRVHAAGSAIVAVATRHDFSALHRLKTDETWHFYGGAPLELVMLYPDGHGARVILGPRVFAGEVPQFTVPQGVWQGAIPSGTASEAYSFFGTQLSPAFDYEDFELGERNELIRRYPQWADHVQQLTRP